MLNFVSTKQLRRLGRADHGQALVLTSLALSVLTLVAGMGVDVGYLRYQKQQMQSAADAGAIAGASALIYRGNWSAAAKNDTAANGFKDGTDGVSVTVNNPPQTTSDPFYNNSNYVEVIITKSQPTFFMLVGGFTSVPVRARAVASATSSASGCIYVLDPTDKDTLTVSGAGTINSGCGIWIDSELADYDVSGSACVTAPTIALVGSVDQNACTNPGPPTTGLPPFSDPLAGVPTPSYATCTSWHTLNINSSQTIYPGEYCGGISINGGTVTLSPGLYVMNGGGFTVNGGGTSITDLGKGVTIFNTGAVSGSGGYRGIKITGGSTATLSAPTDASNGGIVGILFFEDRNISWSAVGSSQTSQITGGSGTSLVGALYFPTTTLTYSGGSSLTAWTDIVAYQLQVTGPSIINDNYSSSSGYSPIHSAAVAE